MNEKIEVVNNGNVFRCDSNIAYREYERLRACADTKEMSPAEVIKYVADHFGFDATKIEPLTTMPLHVFVGSSTTMLTGGTIKRRPLYNATDWNYMLFEVCGMKWEVINGSLEQVVE
jgi:hypothetical protein